MQTSSRYHFLYLFRNVPMFLLYDFEEPVTLACPAYSMYLDLNSGFACLTSAFPAIASCSTLTYHISKTLPKTSDQDTFGLQRQFTVTANNMTHPFPIITARNTGVCHIIILVHKTRKSLQSSKSKDQWQTCLLRR